MEIENLITAAETLNKVLGLKPQIDITVEEKELRTLVREASLWLIPTDKIDAVTVDVLKDMNWQVKDFLHLKKNQDPFPAFRKFEIYDNVDAIAEGHSPEEPGVPKKFDWADTDNVGANGEYLDKEPPPNSAAKRALGPSAYGTALALMGPDPLMSIHELYDIMKDQGFDIKKNSGSIKTAHSIFKKCYRYLKTNGHIKNKK